VVYQAKLRRIEDNPRRLPAKSRRLLLLGDLREGRVRPECEAAVALPASGETQQEDRPQVRLGCAVPAQDKANHVVPLSRLT